MNIKKLTGIKGKHLYSFILMLSFLLFLSIYESRPMLVTLVLGVTIFFCLFISTDHKWLFGIGFVLLLINIGLGLTANFYVKYLVRFEVFSWMLLLVYTLILIVRSMFLNKEVSGHTIFGGLTGYLIIAIIWALLFALIDDTYEDAFHFPPGQLKDIELYMYFSFVTMTTLGYGEIYPTISYSRIACIILTVLGQFYVITIMGLIVGTYINQANEGK